MVVRICGCLGVSPSLRFTWSSYTLPPVPGVPSGAREENWVRQLHFPSTYRSQTRARSWRVNLAVT